MPLLRTEEPLTETPLTAFRDDVRDRDRRCVITGEPALLADAGSWTGFHVARIFPLAYEALWNDNNYGDWITIPPAVESVGSIDSIQNGMLLTASIHARFDQYYFSINPDVCLTNFL